MIFNQGNGRMKLSFTELGYKGQIQDRKRKKPQRSFVLDLTSVICLLDIPAEISSR